MSHNFTLIWTNQTLFYWFVQNCFIPEESSATCSIRAPQTNCALSDQFRSHEWENNIHTRDISHSESWHWIWKDWKKRFGYSWSLSFQMHSLVLIDQNIPEPDHRPDNNQIWPIRAQYYTNWPITAQTTIRSDSGWCGDSSSRWSRWNQETIYSCNRGESAAATSGVVRKMRCFNQNQQPAMLHWANGCGFWSINYFDKNIVSMHIA